MFSAGCQPRHPVECLSATEILSPPCGLNLYPKVPGSMSCRTSFALRYVINNYCYNKAMGVQELVKLKQISNVIKQSVQTEKIYLFGSYAYCTPNTDSDFDICVIIPDNAIRPADAIKTIRHALYSIQDIPRDLLVYRNTDFLKRQQVASLERKISRDGVAVTEISKY